MDEHDARPYLYLLVTMVLFGTEPGPDDAGLAGHRT